MAKKPISLSLPSNGSNDKVKRGTFDIPKGNACKGIRLKCTVPLANTSGGDIALSDAQKQLVLANFLATLAWGPQGKTQPFVAIDWRVVQRLCRRLYGTEIEGYTDSTTGMGKTLTSAATTSIVFYLVLPLGFFWKLRRPAMLAFGRSQMRTVQLDVRRTGTTVIVSGLVISGTVSIDVMPDLVPCKGDPVSPGVSYEEVDDAQKTVRLSPGIPLAIEERTAVHASTTITNFSLFIDDLEVHDQVSPIESITEQNDVPNYPAEAAPTDRVTDLYTIAQQGGTAELKDLPSGAPKIVQNVKDLATIKLSQVYIPILSPSEVNDMMEWAASESGRAKELKGVSTNLTDGLGLGRNTAFAAPFKLVDRDEDEFERYPGPVAAHGMKSDVAIPRSVLAAAKSRYNAHLESGEKNAAENVLHELAATIPGAVQSTRGFKKGDTSLLQRVRREIA